MRLTRAGKPAFTASGVFKLATAKEMAAERVRGRDRTRDIRVSRLFKSLKKLCDGIKFDLIVFEDVKFSVSTAQTQLWSSLRAAVWNSNDAPIEVLHTGGLKIFATGKGNATKEMIEAAFKRKFPGRDSVDDNERDAVFLMEWAIKQLEK